MTNFLPKNYEAPKQSSNYFKFEEGPNKFRIVSEAIVGWEYWTNDNKPIRLKENPREIPKDIRADSAIKHFWAFTVLDRKDGTAKILEITQSTIQRALQALIEDQDWGDPSSYDITITRTGKGLETTYTVQPSPQKPLTKEEQSVVARTEIDLNALFKGESPFEKQDEVVIDSIPF